MKNIYLVLLTLIITFSSFSQGNYDFVKEDAGVSHDVSSEGNVGVTIPLYNVQIDGVSIPIYLSYNNSGIKVSDVPSIVGFNWQLNAGGVIERQLNHIADETKNGWFNSELVESLQTGNVNPSDYKKVDFAPDIFRMSISNGDFLEYFYDRLGDPYNLKLITLNESAPFGIWNNFNIGTMLNEQYQNSNDAEIRMNKNSGINYSFRKGIKRIRPWDVNRRPQSYKDSTDYKDYYLHKVTTDFSTDFINFSYNKTSLNKLVLHAKVTRKQTNNEPQTPPNQNDPVISIGYYQDISVEDVSRKEISKISTNKEIIEFIYKDDFYNNSFNNIQFNNAAVNIDTLRYQDIKLLDEIKIYDFNHNYITGYKFIYTEQTGNGEEFEGMLKIKRILKYGKNHKDTFLFKEFEYYDTSGSNSFADSFAIDVFGYPNGASTNNNLDNCTPLYVNQQETPPNRLPNTNFLTMGMLKSIINSNGGKTKYNYIQNSVDEMYYGGLLVSDINLFDNNENLISKTEYIYEEPEGFGLAVFDDWQSSGQGDLPLNIYEEGYFENHYQGAAAWKTYFTQRSHSTENNANGILDKYNISSIPYALLKKATLTDSFINDLGFQEFEQQKSGYFYKKITVNKINVDSNLSENGYTISYFRPSLTGFSLTGILEKNEVYTSTHILQKEKIFNYEIENHGFSFSYELDNRHFNGFNYNHRIKDIAVCKIKNILKSIEEKNYDDSGNIITDYKTAFSYLNEDDSNLETTDYFRITEEVNYNNNIPFGKTTYKYFNQYDNIPQDLQYLSFYNPIVETSDWSKLNNNWKLKAAVIKKYFYDGKIAEITTVLNNKTTGTSYLENDYVASDYNVSGNLITMGEPTISYEYNNTNGKIAIKKEFKTTINTIYQRGDEYNGLYVDAILTSKSLNNLFLRKSFENKEENNVVKFDKAFSGDCVFNGTSIDLGDFPNDYIVSFWSYENNQWKYHYFIHNGGALTVNKPIGSVYLDELRVQPKLSSMQTFTFRPLIGITSNLNDRGDGERKEFDVFGRPLYLLDKDRNVLKEYRINLTTTN